MSAQHVASVHRQVFATVGHASGGQRLAVMCHGQAAELVRQRRGHVDLLADAIAGAMLLLAGQDGARVELDGVAVLDRSIDEQLLRDIVDQQRGRYVHAGLLGRRRIGQGQA